MLGSCSQLSLSAVGQPMLSVDCYKEIWGEIHFERAWQTPPGSGPPAHTRGMSPWPVHGPFLTDTEEAAELSPGGAGRAGGAQAAGQGCSGDWQSLLGWPGHQDAAPASPSSTALQGRSRSHPALNRGMRITRAFGLSF